MTVIDQRGLEAAVRECARITAPDVTDEEFERERAEGSSRYLKTREEMSRAIGAYLSAQQREPVVRVKMLQWVSEPPFSVARVWGGQYEIERVGGNVELRGDLLCQDFDSIEAAKSAAQADYEQRIMAAIEIQGSDHTSKSTAARNDAGKTGATAGRDRQPIQSSDVEACREPEPSTSEAIADIAAERRRQIEVEGWTPEHDDEHERAEMARAAACYALSGTSADEAIYIHGRWKDISDLFWPWSSDWWKPKDRRRDLVRAGALIVAEIERLDRLASGRR